MTDFSFEGVKRSVLNGATTFLRLFINMIVFLRNCGPLKISLLQCYEVPWIHNIDSICLLKFLSAVEDCLKAAEVVHDANHQKTLMKAAQFGKAFCKISANSSSDKFSTLCKNLRVLNAIKEYEVGIPMTMKQFNQLTAKVVVDRLLQRRLFAVASKICEFLQIQGNCLFGDRALRGRHCTESHNKTHLA